MSATPIAISVGGSRTATEWELHELGWEGFTTTLADRMKRNCGTENHAEYMAQEQAG